MHESTISWYIEKNEAQKAIVLLEKAIEAGEVGWLGIRNYRLQLKELYLLTKQKEHYIRTLRDLILVDQISDIKLYHELKAAHSENEWPDVKTDLIEKLDTPDLLAEIFYEDEAYEALLELVLTQSQGMLERYEHVLKPLYPAELLEKYSLIVSVIAMDAGSRSHYRSMLPLLNHMKTYPNGPEEVTDLVDYLRSRYKNRRTMLDVLKDM